MLLLQGDFPADKLCCTIFFHMFSLVSYAFFEFFFLKHFFFCASVCSSSSWGLGPAFALMPEMSINFTFDVVLLLLQRAFKAEGCLVLWHFVAEPTH